MSSYKNVNTDYTLTCNEGNGIFTINAQTVFTGNVIYTVPATTDFAFLTVAANNTGAITDGGLLMKTSASNTYAGFRFDTTANAWQTSPSVYANGAPIVPYGSLSTSAGGSNTYVQFNDGGSFGGINTFTFDKNTNQLTLNGTQVFGNINTTPANVANAVILYSNTVGAGGTGLYTQSEGGGGSDELVANYKAIVYGIIF